MQLGPRKDRTTAIRRTNVYYVYDELILLRFRKSLNQASILSIYVVVVLHHGPKCARIIGHDRQE